MNAGSRPPHSLISITLARLPLMAATESLSVHMHIAVRIITGW